MTTLIDTLAFIVAAAAAGLSVPALVFVVEVLVALAPRRRRGFPKSDASYAVIVPAHDEERGLGETLDALVPAVRGNGRVVVVADNCSDRTAEIARARGVIVLERNDVEHRGKGYALAHAVDSLADDPPEVLVFVDADCIVDQEAIGILVDTAVATSRPVQADYVLESSGDSPATAISTFAFAVRNRMRPRGLARLGGPSGLFGTGMAMPYSLFEALPSAESHLVEDMWLGVQCALRGRAPVFAEDAFVESAAAPSDRSTRAQRTRWEQGHLGVLLRDVPRLFAKRSRDSILLGLDLVVPPLAMLVAMLVLAFASGLVLSVFGGTRIGPAIAGIALGSVGVAVITAWADVGRAILPAKTLLRIPEYVLWKLPIYFGFARKPQASWVRTDRT